MSTTVTSAPWLTDAPYTPDVIDRFNRYTHFPTTLAAQNADFAASVQRIEAETVARLSKHGVTEMPDAVRAALDNVRKTRYEWFVRWVRAREIAPPWSVVGRGNYSKHARPEKARKHEEVGYRNDEAAKARLERAIGRYCPDPNRISSDDPDALLLLDDRIADLEQLQGQMKVVNAALRKHKEEPEQVAALMDLGLSEEAARGLLKPDWAGRIGYPGYALTNNNANIRRLKERRKLLEARREQSDTEARFDGGRVLDNVAENRLQILFDVKPDAAMRAELKMRGFRWSPNAGAWQRMRGADAVRAAQGALDVTLTLTATHQGETE